MAVQCRFPSAVGADGHIRPRTHSPDIAHILHPPVPEGPPESPLPPPPPPPDAGTAVHGDGAASVHTDPATAAAAEASARSVGEGVGAVPVSSPLSTSRQTPPPLVDPTSARAPVVTTARGRSTRPSFALPHGASDEAVQRALDNHPSPVHSSTRDDGDADGETAADAGDGDGDGHGEAVSSGGSDGQGSDGDSTARDVGQPAYAGVDPASLASAMSRAQSFHNGAVTDTDGAAKVTPSVLASPRTPPQVPPLALPAVTSDAIPVTGRSSQRSTRRFSAVRSPAASARQTPREFGYDIVKEPSGEGEGEGEGKADSGDGGGDGPNTNRTKRRRRRSRAGSRSSRAGSRAVSPETGAALAEGLALLSGPEPGKPAAAVAVGTTPAAAPAPTGSGGGAGSTASDAAPAAAPAAAATPVSGGEAMVAASPPSMANAPAPKAAAPGTSQSNGVHGDDDLQPEEVKGIEERNAQRLARLEVGHSML